MIPKRDTHTWKLSDANAPERFAKFVEPEPMSGCHLWTGRTDPDGYGEMHIPTGEKGRRRTIKAHRAAWIIAHGPLRTDQHVLHRCDNPPCVNLDHLFLADHAENMRDMARKGKGTKSKSGLPFGVSAHLDRFCARDNGKHLGVFDSAEEAASVAMASKQSRLGVCV